VIILYVMTRVTAGTGTVEVYGSTYGRRLGVLLGLILRKQKDTEYSRRARSLYTSKGA
jgi:hypothetical protein